MDFWQRIDELIENFEVVIDRPKGKNHPKYKDMIYPIDYGYLKNTNASDKHEIDVFVGSLKDKVVTSIITTVDSLKGDLETKILLSCTKEEEMLIKKFLNNKYMSCFLVPRN